MGYFFAVLGLLLWGWAWKTRWRRGLGPILLFVSSVSCGSRALLRRIAAMGLLGCAFVGFVPFGCSSSIERVPLRYREETKGPRLPDITVERLQACVDEYGRQQLEERTYRIDAKVKSDRDGRILDVHMDGIPGNASDFAACTQTALQDMTIPGALLQLRPGQTLGIADKPMVLHRNEAGNVLIVGVLIVLGEFAAQYGGYVILFAVTVELVDTAVKDIAGVLRREDEIKEDCRHEFQKCLLSDTADEYGSVEGSSRCEWCLQACTRNGGNWPFRAPKAVGWVRCDYWRRADGD